MSGDGGDENALVWTALPRYINLNENFKTLIGTWVPQVHEEEEREMYINTLANTMLIIVGKCEEQESKKNLSVPTPTRDALTDLFGKINTTFVGVKRLRIENKHITFTSILNRNIATVPLPEGFECFKKSDAVVNIYDCLNQKPVKIMIASDDTDGSDSPMAVDANFADRGLSV
jgi:hypothetical protein